MKKSIVLFILLVLSIQILSSESVSSENESQEIEEESIEKESIADVTLIKNIIGDIARYNPNPKDTEVQRKIREKNLKAYLKEINTKWIDKNVSFEYLTLSDVEADKELSKEGLKQAKKIIQQIKNDPGTKMLYGDVNLEKNPFLALAIGLQLAFCSSCWQETGKYNVNYYFGRSPNYYDSKIILESNKENEFNNQIELQIKIQKIYPNEASVINLTKHKVERISGTIKSINYETGYSQPTLSIYLK
jgi:hypothetical protein